MASQSDVLLACGSPGNALPEYWPEVAGAEPVRAVWLPWPIAVVLAPLFWVLPKRMGVHFAAVRWPGVIVAHLLWTIYGIGCITMAYAATEWSWAAYVAGETPAQQAGSLWPVTLSEIARMPLALLALGLTHEIDDFEEFVGGVGAVAGAELCAVGVAMLLMPYAAAGEKARRLSARCVKLTLWSTTSLVVLGLVLQMIELGWLGGDRQAKASATATAISLYVVWFVWMWIRSGLRYGGDAEGPGWDRRRPRCETCGYTLTGLTADDRCPECGVAVAESLPATRQPSAYAAARGILARVPAFFRTLAEALVGRGFYQHLSVLDGHAAARRFAIWVCVLCGPAAFVTMMAGAVFLLGIPLASLAASELGGPWWGLATFVMVWVIVSVALLCGLGVLGLLDARFGHQPVRERATVLFYWSAWMLPVAVSAAMATVCVGWLGKHGYMRGVVRLWALGAVDREFLCLTMPYAFPLLVLVVGLVRLMRATRQTRFANA